LLPVLAQASDEELLRAHTEAHVKFVSGPPRVDDWLMGDNFFSPGTPLACRLAAGCTMQVCMRCPSSCNMPY
jgi:acetoin utilization deacetylase AcuC-like enzyme